MQATIEVPHLKLIFSKLIKYFDIKVPLVKKELESKKTFVTLFIKIGTLEIIV